MKPWLFILMGWKVRLEKAVSHFFRVWFIAYRCKVRKLNN